MHERVKTINKYYINLEYDIMYINKKNVSMNMNNACTINKN